MGLRMKAGQGEGTIPGNGRGGDSSLGGRIVKNSTRGD
jgi:hypothetical protein